MTVCLYADWIPKKYKDWEEDISMNMKKLFPKASKEGRVKVKLGACGCSVILTIR